MENSTMTVKRALKVLKETGEYLNYHVGTDSYVQRCKLFDARKVLEAHANSKIPSEKEIKKEANNDYLASEGEGLEIAAFIEGAKWVKSLAKTTNNN